MLWAVKRFDNINDIAEKHWERLTAIEFFKTQ